MTYTKTMGFLALLCCLLATPFRSQAQNYPGLSFKRIFTDYQTLNGGDFGALKDYRNGWELGFHLPFSRNLSLNVPVRLGLSDKDSDFIVSRFISADAQLHFHFLSNPNLFRPYLLAGVGFLSQHAKRANTQSLQVPAGIGLDVRITDNAWFNLQGEFRWSSAENNNSFNYGIGFKYFFAPVVQEETGPVDSDGDGIPDVVDACPYEEGTLAFNGCPDTDLDGIADPNDDCPDVPGVMAFNGCPDTDLDGLPDPKDACPNEAGPISNNGCPVEVKADTDGDGVTDDVDRCPDVPGLAQFGGCPDRDGDGIEDLADSCPDKPGPAMYNGCPDTDGDGLPDPKDACPRTPGPIENNGCPVIEKADREVLTFAMRAVQFELAKATLKPESHSILNQIVTIMKKYPDYDLSIEGHTDSTGSDADNQRLSEARAKSCHDYLVGKGIADERLHYRGYGESRPVADNATYSGRTLNRRVEFNMIPPK